uniref:L-arabinitol 4-dehydrogenase n=1 Tax=Bionectria ochroleuca TaxID=29856 RepID=A0A8H7TN98_BIOOC
MGTPVAVFGAGPIGLLTMAVARASGAYPIVISDIDENRLAFAKAFEPNCRTYKVDPADSPEQSAAKVRDLFERKGWESSAGRTEYDMPNVVLECTGIESSIATAAFTVRRGGSINVVGVSSRPSINNIPFMHMSLAEIQLRFINRYHDTWPAALRALEGGLIDPTKVDGLVTHRFKLEDAIDAMNLVAGITKPAPGERVVKVQIVDELEVEIP